MEGLSASRLSVASFGLKLLLYKHASTHRSLAVFAILTDPSFVLVKIDLRNAYNECDRANMLESLITAALQSVGIGGIVPMFLRMYGPEAAIYLGSTLARLFEGAEGGDSSTGERCTELLR